MGKGKISWDDYIQQLQDCTMKDVDANVVYRDDFYRELTDVQYKQLVFRNVWNRLVNIILKMYKWTVPESFNPRAIELGLLYRGWMCAYTGPQGTFCLPAVPLNMFNIYGDPTQVRVYGFNGYNEVVNINYDYKAPTPNDFNIDQETVNNGVFMRDNDMAYPYIQYIREFAWSLTDKILTFNTACQRMKMPFIFTGVDRALVDSVKQIEDKIRNNDVTVVLIKNNGVDTGIDNLRLENWNINPAAVQQAINDITVEFNRFLETLGINTNPSPDKSQVVLTPELSSNNSLIDLEKDVRFMNRQKFCEDCNKVLGLNMSVELNIDELQSEIDKFGKEFTNGKETKDSSSEG